MNHTPPTLKIEDFRSSPLMRIESVAPLHGDSELYVVIDDAANYDFGTKLDELRSFVNSQTMSSAVGLAFIKNGELGIAQTPTKDHELIARALRAPAGSKPGNPYCAVSALIDGWKGSTEGREILMITSGLETGGAAASCGTADSAISVAERAGVSIFAIYHPVADYASETWQHIDTGEVELAHLCYETGGEAYFISHEPMETITPFLEDMAEHLENQYRLTVIFDGLSEPGLTTVYLYPVSPNLELMAPAKVLAGGIHR